MLKDIISGYGEKEVINGISFSVESGEFIGIIGPNGAGKSTLLKTIGRVIHPKSGRVSIGEEDVFKMPLKEFAKSVAFVGQDTQIAFPFTVLEIVLMGRFPYLRVFQSESKEDLDAVHQALTVTDCTNFISRPIDQLSAGERQRVFIAKALAQNPKLILLDEPTSHLDISHQIQILDILKELSEANGISMISVFHDLNLASEYCDRLLLIDNGIIFAEGKPQEVLKYEILEEVYKTVVIVKENPLSRRPYILLTPRLKRMKDG